VSPPGPPGAEVPVAENPADDGSGAEMSGHEVSGDAAALPLADRRSRGIAAAATAVLAAAAFAALPPVGAALAALGTAGALWATVIDLERFEIPDGAVLAILATGIGFAVTGGVQAPAPLAAELALLLAGVTPFPGSGAESGAIAVADAVGRAVFVLAVLRALQLGYRRLRGVEGFGTGDVKLAAALATWLAWDELDSALTVAVAAALVAVGIAALRRGRVAAAAPIPFGAFLALATLGVAAARIAG